MTLTEADRRNLERCRKRDHADVYKKITSAKKSRSLIEHHDRKRRRKAMIEAGLLIPISPN